MSDCLVEISPKELPALKNRYKNDESNNILAILTIENYIRWFEQDPNVEYVKFFCLNGDFSDGSFVVLDFSTAYADTLNESKDKLLRLLQLIDYSKQFTFLNIRPEIQPVLRRALQKAAVDITFDNKTLLFRLPKEDALKLDVKPPQGIELRPLAELSDLEKADSVWPHRHEGSLTQFERLAKFNLTVGAFTSDKTLVSWIFRYSTGLVGILQTDERFYGKGYASLVTRALLKNIAETGDDVYVGIFEHNTASRTLFEKLGFKPIGEIHYILNEVKTGNK